MRKKEFGEMTVFNARKFESVRIFFSRKSLDWFGFWIRKKNGNPIRYTTRIFFTCMRNKFETVWLNLRPIDSYFCGYFYKKKNRKKRNEFSTPGCQYYFEKRKQKYTHTIEWRAHTIKRFYNSFLAQDTCHTNTRTHTYSCAASIKFCIHTKCVPAHAS